MAKIKYEKEYPLKQEEIDSIGAQQVEEFDNPILTLGTAIKKKKAREDFIKETITLLNSKRDIQPDKTLSEFENEEIKALSQLKGSAITSIRNAISNYNDVQRRGDVFLKNTTLDSVYPCKSITCKERGKKIQNALRDLLMFSPEALGQIGYSTSESTMTSISNSFSSLFKKKEVEFDLSEILKLNNKAIDIAKKIRCQPNESIETLKTKINQINNGDPNYSEKVKDKWTNVIDDLLKMYKLNKSRKIIDLVNISIGDDRSCTFAGIDDILVLLRIFPYVDDINMKINDPLITQNINGIYNEDSVTDITQIDQYKKKKCLLNIIINYIAWCKTSDKNWLDITTIIDLISKKIENPDINLSTENKDLPKDPKRISRQRELKQSQLNQLRQQIRQELRQELRPKSYTPPHPYNPIPPPRQPVPRGQTPQSFSSAAFQQTVQAHMDTKRTRHGHKNHRGGGGTKKYKNRKTRRFS